LVEIAGCQPTLQPFGRLVDRNVEIPIERYLTASGCQKRHRITGLLLNERSSGSGFFFFLLLILLLNPSVDFRELRFHCVELSLQRFHTGLEIAQGVSPRHPGNGACQRA
jgi:hypothetical protein